MLVRMLVRMCLRTGGVFDLSTTRFAIVPTTALPQQHTPPQVANKFVCFFMEWHRLVEIGQESPE